jgi:hypothetical protein
VTNPPASYLPNPAFTFFSDDVLAWEPLFWLTDAQLGQAFKLIVYGSKLGSRLPKGHPLLDLIDPKIVSLCTTDEGEYLAVVHPLDLPKLMMARRRYLDARREAGSKGGRQSVASRRAKHGTARPQRKGCAEA